MLIALAVEYIAAKGWFVVTTNVNGSGALMLAMFVVYECRMLADCCWLIWNEKRTSADVTG